MVQNTGDLRSDGSPRQSSLGHVPEETNARRLEDLGSPAVPVAVRRPLDHVEPRGLTISWILGLYSQPQEYLLPDLNETPSSDISMDSQLQLGQLGEDATAALPPVKRRRIGDPITHEHEDSGKNLVVAEPGKQLHALEGKSSGLESSDHSLQVEYMDDWHESPSVRSRRETKRGKLIVYKRRSQMIGSSTQGQKYNTQSPLLGVTQRIDNVEVPQAQYQDSPSSSDGKELTLHSIEESGPKGQRKTTSDKVQGNMSMSDIMDHASGKPGSLKALKERIGQKEGIRVGATQCSKTKKKSKSRKIAWRCPCMAMENDHRCKHHREKANKIAEVRKELARMNAKFAQVDKL